MATTEASNIVKEFTPHYHDITQISQSILVWEALIALEPKHYLGATAEEIEKHTRLPEKTVIEMLATLNGGSCDGPVEIKLSQEGTSGPFVHRYKPKPDCIIVFNLALPCDSNSSKRYKIKTYNQQA